MSLLAITLAGGLILLVAYFTYGRWIVGRLALTDTPTTPACQINDGVDYVPTPAPYLFSQHFSAIAAAGPIVGPIVAGLIFGWAPALIWILVGSILIGGVHDIASLVASVRHKARSIGEVVREHMSRRAYLLFLSFVWIALVYIVVAFTDLTASTFAPRPPATATAISDGQAVASSSMMYLLLAVAMGLVLRFTRLSLVWATLIFMPLVLVSIWAGEKLPLGLPEWMWIDGSAAKTWDVLLLLYCGVASVVPVWALLQPRGFLGGYFLSATVLLAFLGILAASLMGEAITITYPAFRGSLGDGLGAALSVSHPLLHTKVWLFPVLFVTIACGACSGFHSMICSGTSSKQLRTEKDAKVVGYGAMLLEAFVAIIALGCVMILSPGDWGSPDKLFAGGVSKFIGGLASAFGIEKSAAETYLFQFALLAFATFIYDTLDVCTRLGRYVLEEFTGWKGGAGRLACTVLTLLPPLYLVLQTQLDDKGNVVPAWSAFWILFGTANQLLAALALTGVTVWLLRTGKSWKYVAAPAAFMAAVTFTSLGMMLWSWGGKLAAAIGSGKSGGWFDINGLLSAVLFGLAMWLVVEALIIIRRTLVERAASANA